MPLLWNVRHALLHHGKIKSKLKRHLVHITKGNAAEHQTENNKKTVVRKDKISDDELQ